ncbi:MAG: hypothetical protein IIA89_08155 [Chloroflexi bacterium]|nr:hypothetical protein [Chloroflexota bacterium]
MRDLLRVKLTGALFEPCSSVHAPPGAPGGAAGVGNPGAKKDLRHFMLSPKQPVLARLGKRAVAMELT